MSGHVHPDELTESERHSYKLCNPSYCSYCAADKHYQERTDKIKDLEAEVTRLQGEVKTLQEEAMRRDTLPEFERGEYAGQDAMMQHIAKLDERNNSALALAVRHCELFKVRADVLRQVAENLEAASYKFREPFDPEAAKALHFELCVVQARAETYAGKKEE